MRSGTLNVPGIVGFGKAAEIALAELPEESKRLLALREKLRLGIEARGQPHGPQRLAGAPVARQPENQLRFRRGRGP